MVLENSGESEHPVMFYYADVESLVLMAIKYVCRRRDAAIKFSCGDNESFASNFSKTMQL